MFSPLIWTSLLFHRQTSEHEAKQAWMLTKRCTSILIFWNCLLHHMLTPSHCAVVTQQSLVNIWKKKDIQKKTCKINLNAWNSSSFTGQSVGLSEFPGSVTANRLTQRLHFLSFQTWWGHTFVGEQIQCKFPQSNSAPGLFFLPYTLLRIEANVWAARGHLCWQQDFLSASFLAEMHQHGAALCEGGWRKQIRPERKSWTCMRPLALLASQMPYMGIFSPSALYFSDTYLQKQSKCDILQFPHCGKINIFIFIHS